MRPPHDLMDRLAAADPMPDAERLGPEQHHEADALLERLLATPVEPARRKRSHRRWTRLTAATACAAAGLFVVLNLVDSDAPAPGVIDRAIAALSDGDAVYHVVSRSRGEVSFDPRGARTLWNESWHTTSGMMHNRWYTDRNGRRGRYVEDFAGRRRPGRHGGPALRWSIMTNTITESGFGSSGGGGGAPGINPFDPARGLRELQAEGRLRVAGTTVVDGRRAYRLVSGTVRGSGGSKEHTELLVDAETYLPLAQRYSGVYKDDSTFKVFTRYVTYERLPLNDKTKAQLDLDPHPGAKCSPFAGKMKGKRDVGFPNPCAR
jgi:hypothetical protein